MKYSWIIFLVCGLVIIAYGAFLFFIMPAPGIFVVIGGLICLNIGIKGWLKTIKNIPENKQHLIHKDKKTGPSAPQNKLKGPYRFIAMLMLVTNLIVIKSVMPNLSSHVGRDLGDILEAILTFLCPLLYTALIFYCFRSLQSLILFMVFTWIAIIVRELY